MVGYDDLPIASYTCPPLTTIRTHPFEQGKLLAEAAIALMNNEKVGSQQDALPLELVVRSSCGASNREKLSFPRAQKKSDKHSKLRKTHSPRRRDSAVEL